MVPLRDHLLFVGVTLAFCLSSGAAKVISAHLNVSQSGICILEVPSVDLLTPEDRAKGIRPQGNATKPGFSRIEVCCSGWTRKPHARFQCEPVCDTGCPNGNCTAPNVCTCKKGYIKDPSQNCIPTCPIGCLNGLCTHQGICSCNAGFRLSPDGKFCIPVCTGGCGVGGECIGAEACRCREGFTLSPRTHKCEYHCPNGCGAGTCIAPNTCSCGPGFKLSAGTCIPECPKGCTNGKCSAPGVCTCDPGWTQDRSGTLCQAHCRDPCLNADCTAPNTCTCKKGYAPDPGNPIGNKCVAFCPGGCPNGICSAPNFCICNPGFVKEAKGSNVCVRRLRREALMHFELIPPQTKK